MTITDNDTITLPATSGNPVGAVLHNPVFNISVHPPVKAAIASKPLLPKPSVKASKPLNDSTPVVGSDPKPVTITETNTHDIQGRRIEKWTDSKGASVTFYYKPNNEAEIEFAVPANRITATHTNKRGFSGSTYYKVPELGVEKPVEQLESASGSVVKPHWFDDKAKVSCGTVSKEVTDEVIDAAARERIQKFGKENPELAAKLRSSKRPITVIGGVSATMEQVENSPGNFKACPENMRGIGAVQAL